MYSILVTLNSSYFNYGKIFIRSLYDNNDMEKVSKVYVADTGLTEEEKDYFGTFEKTVIFSTGLTSNFNKGGTWGEGWQTSVTSKTLSLKWILEHSVEDVMMIDADCLVLKDLSPLIKKHSIQVCNRAEENKDIPFLGSYVYIKNNSTGLQFVSNWIENIRQSSLDRAKESPMLGKTVKEFNLEDIYSIERVMVSCYTKKEYTRHKEAPYIAHFKGGSLSQIIEEDQRKRIFGTHGFDEEVKKYL